MGCVPGSVPRHNGDPCANGDRREAKDREGSRGCRDGQAAPWCCPHIILSPSPSATSEAMGYCPQPLAPHRRGRGGEGDPPTAMSWHGDPRGKREVEGKCLCLRKSITYISSPQLQTSLQITQLQHRQSSHTKSQAERRDSCWVFTPASPAGSLGQGGGTEGGQSSAPINSGLVHFIHSPWQHRRELHDQPLRKRFCK